MTRFTAATVGICGAVLAVEAALAFGAGVPREVSVALASAAAVLAATVAIRNVAFVWRGPVIIRFAPAEGMLCDAREAHTVRAAAQLRGTMGGAGYLYPRRLAFCAISWAAISVQSLALLTPQQTAVAFVPLGVALVAGVAAARFPACAFYYREAGGGCVLAFPPGVCRRLLEAAGVEPALRPIDLRAFAGAEAEVGPSSTASVSPDVAGEDVPPPGSSSTV